MTLQIPTIDDSRVNSRRRDAVGMPIDFEVAFEAFASYLVRRLPATPVDAAAAVLDDLAALFAEAVADGSPLRAVVGNDPAEIAEALLANHAELSCNRQARADLARAIDAVAG